jgi:hypothetical protein
MGELNAHTDHGITQSVFLRDSRFASIERCRNCGFIRIDGGLVRRQINWRLGKDRRVLGKSLSECREVAAQRSHPAFWPIR